MVVEPLKLTVEAKLQNLSLIADFVSSAMERLGVTEGAEQIKLAVDEACTNVIKYAYAGKSGPLAIECSVRGGSLVILINDRGTPFNPDAVAAPDLDADLERRRIGGLGIHLMKKFMDDVSYSFDEGSGNTLVMKKRLAGK